MTTRDLSSLALALTALTVAVGIAWATASGDAGTFVAAFAPTEPPVFTRCLDGCPAAWDQGERLACAERCVELERERAVAVECIRRCDRIDWVKYPDEAGQCLTRCGSASRAAFAGTAPACWE